MRLESERAERIRCYLARNKGKPSGSRSGEPLDEIERDFRRKIERALDLGLGCCALARPDIATLVASALRHFDNARYLLHAWVVMPNHVHAVLWPMPNHALGDILQSWKGYTAREANRILAVRNRPFWQTESYDHWIRNDKEHERCSRYVIWNPVKAKLCALPQDWRWSSAWSKPG
jgi:REP element-mobilizing transposase RayT